MINEKQIVGNEIKLGKDDLHHVFNVMRKKMFDKFYCVNIDNQQRYLCQINCESKIEIVKILDLNNELPFEFVLAFALVKSDKMEFVLQKASELGVSKFIPLKTKYSVVKIDENKVTKKMERWLKIVKEACEQAKRNNLMEISRPKTIEELKEELCQVNLVAYEEEGKHNYQNKIKNHYHGQASIMVVVGAEGGFDNSEIEAFKSLDIKPISLGKRILRCETAAISVCCLIADLME